MELQPNVWNVERLRLSGFRIPGTSFDAGQAWDIVAQVPADEVTRKPAAGIEQHQARIGDANLLLNVEIGRIDWIYSAVQPEDAPGFSAIGLYDRTIDDFSQIARRWFSMGPAISRLAYGSTLLEPAPDRIAAYERLGTLLKSVNIDSAHSADLFYQINRFTTSNVVEHLIVNRLSKWACQKVALFLAQAVGEQGNLSNALREEQAARVEIDINTDGARSTALPSEALAPLLLEFEQYSKNIAENGDPA